jgi:hypothetical protein
MLISRVASNMTGKKTSRFLARTSRENSAGIERVHVGEDRSQPIICTPHPSPNRSSGCTSTLAKKERADLERCLTVQTRNANLTTFRELALRDVVWPKVLQLFALFNEQKPLDGYRQVRNCAESPFPHAECWRRQRLTPTEKTPSACVTPGSQET